MAHAPAQSSVGLPRAAAQEPGLGEAIFLIFVSFYGAKALFLLLAIGPQGLTDNQIQDLPSGPFRLLWGLTYLVGAGFCLRHFNAFYAGARSSLVIPLLIGWCLATTLWSASPAVTLQHAVTLAICAAIGVFWGARFTSDGIVAITAYALAAALVLSAILIFFVPGWGEMPGKHAGAWSGVFIHKNGLGSAAVLGAICFGYMAWRARARARLVWLGLLALSVLMVLGSRSATALVALLAVGAAVPIIGLIRLRGLDLALVLVGVATAGVLGLVLFATTFELILSLLGKDMTLTGRVELWQWGLRAFLERPLGGYGLESFWLDPSDYGGLRIRVLADWLAPHIHNSWLQIGLDTGAIGVGLFAVFFVGIAWRAVALARHAETPVYHVVLLILLTVALYSMVETILLKRNSQTFIMLVALHVALSREWLEARLAQREPAGEPIGTAC